MEDWLGVGIAVVSLGMSGVAMWWSRRGLKAFLLSDLHERIRQLKAAALDHLDVDAGEYPTERDVEALRDRVMQLHVPWKDVRDATEQLIEECNGVLVPRVREAPYEQQEEIRRRIRQRFEAARTTINAHEAAVRSLRGLAGHGWRRARQ